MRLFQILLLTLPLLTGCTGIPEGLTVVDGFELPRYLGTWHEIARLDHRFERGLSEIRAEYSLREDGGVRVLNSGFDAETNQRRSAEGKAYFIDGPDRGRLKVSFFGPFYGAYNIIALDKAAYQYAMVAGPDRDYLWILARTPDLAQPILDSLLEQARSQGFATDQLIFAAPRH
ncbi:lipocalin family protein [Methylomonas sp. SURF-1]|uniref:Outer membrane lipoprotein Blc n=1 Tax=Methylomonas aurea TaxID=2952224 RepID=A0ABT1UJE5_9GAMM|nr:lipocalin family protein [Methylomonas sp. SURF-1]MCQ8182247.1 lipocalin family protein [Methylomonas sp. SURF-1]